MKHYSKEFKEEALKQIQSSDALEKLRHVQVAGTADDVFDCADGIVETLKDRSLRIGVAVCGGLKLKGKGLHEKLRNVNILYVCLI